VRVTANGVYYPGFQRRIQQCGNCEEDIVNVAEIGK
jgi:hypothetical protein